MEWMAEATNIQRKIKIMESNKMTAFKLSTHHLFTNSTYGWKNQLSTSSKW